MAKQVNRKSKQGHKIISHPKMTTLSSFTHLCTFSVDFPNTFMAFLVFCAINHLFMNVKNQPFRHAARNASDAGRALHERSPKWDTFTEYDRLGPQNGNYKDTNKWK